MKIYVTDGSATGFYTAVFDAYTQKDCTITSQKDVQLSFDSELVYVKNDEEKCERVRSGIYAIDSEADGDIMLVLRSCDPLKEQTALEYIRLVFAHKRSVKKMMQLPVVIEFNEIIGKVTGEVHKLKGFLRFMESADGALYAPYSPDNDITDLLMPHFAARLSSERFVIHDLKRKVAGMYNGHEWIMCEAGEAEIYLSEYERTFENLWKKYYKSVNIESRPHEKQMKGYMPVRYWKYLPEKKI